MQVGFCFVEYRLGQRTPKSLRQLTKCYQRGRPSSFKDQSYHPYDLGRRSTNEGRSVIVPGQRPGAGRPQQLITPDSRDFQQQDDEKPSGPIRRRSIEQSIVGDVPEPAVPKHYTPPADMYLDEKAETEDEIDAAEMLSRLMTNEGSWHERALYFTALEAAMFDAHTIENMTGISRADQSVLRIAGQVFQSLKQSGKLSSSELEHFSQQGPEVLYELRFLPNHRRASSAAYAAVHNLDVMRCRRLARATIDHERKEETSLGFSEEPGDVLAFAEYRDAIEARTEEKRLEHLEAGLQLAVTEGARERLQALLPENVAAVEAAIGISTTPMTVLRLIPEEVQQRPVAVAGDWGQVTPQDIQTAPMAMPTGPFQAFTPSTGQACQWTVFPAWEQLVTAGSPVAIFIPDCGQITQLIPTLAASAVTEEDRQKQSSGPAMLVVERKRIGREINTWYLMAVEGGKLLLVDGEQRAMVEGAVLGRVLFVCRPPRKQKGGISESDMFEM